MRGSKAYLVVQLHGRMETVIFHQVVDQVVPADLDLVAAAGQTSCHERLVKPALLEHPRDMLSDVIGIGSEAKNSLHRGFQLLLILLLPILVTLGVYIFIRQVSPIVTNRFCFDRTVFLGWGMLLAGSYGTFDGTAQVGVYRLRSVCSPRGY